MIGALRIHAFLPFGGTLCLIALLCLVLTTTALAKTDSNVFTSANLTAEEKAYIQTHKPLMAYDPLWPPFDYRNNAGHHAGIIADILRLITNKTSLRITPIHTDTWAETITLAKQGRVDIVSMLNQSEEREGYLSFTTPIIDSPQVIVARSDSENITDLQSITGPIAIVNSYITELLISQSKPDATLLKAASTMETLEMVSDGQAQATILTEVEANHLIRKKKWDHMEIKGSTPYTNVLRIGIRKDDKILLSILQKGLDSITFSEHEKIMHKWLAYHTHTNDAPFTKWKVLILAIISLAVSITVIRKSAFRGKK